jgi:hypothetical protein
MSSLSWTRISALELTFPVAPTDAAGSPVTIAGVDCALLAYRAKGPDAATVWVAASYDAGTGEATILVAGPDAADPGAGGLQLANGSGGGDVWARVIDNPEVDAQFVCRIDLVG